MRKKIIIYKNVRITLLSDYTFKAEYSPDGKFISKDLFISDISYSKLLRCAVRKKNYILTIETNYLKIICRDVLSRFSKKTLKVYYKYKNTAKRWHYGKKDRQNLKGSCLHLFKYPKEVKGNLSQGVLSKNGYFSYYDNTFMFWDKGRNWAQLNRRACYDILFFIGYGDNFKRGLLEFSNIFGKAVMPPVWAFGFWYSRYWAYNQNEFIDLVKKYRSLDIPLDVMVIDTDWRKAVWRGYEWSKKFFSKPDKFIKIMKKMGVKLTLNDHPGYNESEYLPEDEKIYKKIMKFLKMNEKQQNGWHPDWSNQNEVKAFCGFLLKPKLKQGIDFWWIDGWGANGLDRNEALFKKKKDVDKMALGVDGYYGINPQLWLNHFYYRATKEQGNKRPMVLSRWGGFGSQRYPVWFSGDTYSSWKTLAFQVYFTYTAGNVLTNYWSHDMGGFLGRNISKELFIRWIQFGAFSPIMRIHSDHGIREPWRFDKETIEIFKKYVRIRYRLILYFYQCAYISYKTGMPIIRGLYHNYPDNKESYKHKDEYLIGDNILVAPVVRSMGNKKVIKKKICFPEGEWLGIETGYTCMGPSKGKIITGLDIIPFFIRKNSIIPVNQDVQYIDPDKNKKLTFEIFSPDNCKLQYYEDDGITDDYQKNKYINIPIEIVKKEGRFILKLGKLKGAYSGMKTKREIEIILHFIEDINIKNVYSIKTKYKIIKTDKVLGEIPSHYNSYQINLKYNGSSQEVFFNYGI